MRQLRSLGASVLVQDADRFVAPPDDWEVVTEPAPTDDAVARPGAGLAGVRPHHLQRHRRGERRPGGRGRAPASSPGWWRPRSPWPRPASGPRAAPAASDAFFPFPDGLEVLAGAGVTAVVQPGGSVATPR